MTLPIPVASPAITVSERANQNPSGTIAGSIDWGEDCWNA